MPRRYVPKTYKNYHVIRLLLKIVLSILLAGVVLFVSLFFGLRKYFIPTENGMRLVIPFLEESGEPPPS